MPKALATSNPSSTGFSDAAFQDPPETSLFPKCRYRHPDGTDTFDGRIRR